MPRDLTFRDSMWPQTGPLSSRGATSEENQRYAENLSANCSLPLTSDLCPLTPDPGSSVQQILLTWVELRV
ncbi:unnamed protein product [Boreogadus saida]